MTVLVPWVPPKFVPVMVTEVPTGPEDGERLVMPGVTVKFTLLLANPTTVITTGAAPRPRLAGTGALTLVALQLVGETVTPPMLTVLLPCVAPKLVPVIVSEVPTGPEVGDTLVIPGVTVKFTPGLARPLTVTTTALLPASAPTGTEVVMLLALQFVGLVLRPPKVTVLVP